MLSKLQALFPNAILYSVPPDNSLDLFHVFYDRVEEEWIAIPKKDLSEKEVNILSIVYELSKPLPPIHQSYSLAKNWYEFLFSNGQLPYSRNKSYIRFIQFQLKGSPVEKPEIESAMAGFFSEEVLILWQNSRCGVIIEIHKQKQPLLSEKELTSMAETLESDFYINCTFYYGKEYLLTYGLREHFHEEKEYFSFALLRLNQVKFLSFERVFPYYLAFHLQEPLKEILIKPFTAIFKEDPEMFATIKVFLENNLNASLTAKKLYIHRNTLQYRIDKFTEKTGIQFKDFYGAFTVFLACLLFDEHNQQSAK